MILGVLAGCGGPARQPEEISTGLSRLTGPEAPVMGGPSPMPEDRPPPNSLAAAAAHNAALDLLAWNDRKDARPATPPPAVPQEVPAESAPPEPVDAGLSVGPPDPGGGDGLDQQITAAAATLGDLLRRRAGATTDLFGASLELAALGTLFPGLDAGADADLSPAERESLKAFEALIGALAVPGVGGDPGRVADAFAAAVEGMSASLPVRIRAAELCTRVDGFGQYVPVEGNVFQSMRPHRVIVYTEVERFAYEPLGEADLGSHRAGPGDRWAVNLTQQLELYNETGAMSAWSRPALPVVETSRNKRRDFHIVDQIDLPPNLSIGIYHLKITVKDRATGAQDTRSVELRIVADPALARAGR
jgi:hypothetical protein